MQNKTNRATTITLNDPADLAATRIAFLRRRRISETRAALIAELAFPASSSWIGERA